VDDALQRYSLVTWARRLGLTPRQARYAVRTGELSRLQLPEGGRVERAASGRFDVLVPRCGPRQGGVALYARAWHRDSWELLAQQTAALEDWAATKQHRVLAVVREVAGPFEMPRHLTRLLGDPSYPIIAVTHKRVLGWLNAPFLSAILESQGRELVDLGLHVASAESHLQESWRALTDLQALSARVLTEMQEALERLLRLPPPRP
jgi:predicted site-specific integrase-resolvase